MHKRPREPVLVSKPRVNHRQHLVVIGINTPDALIAEAI